MVSIFSGISGLFGRKEEALPEGERLRWVLGRVCRGCKVCEPNAFRDLHGLGPGVYPREDFPAMHRGCDCAAVKADADAAENTGR